LFPVNGRRKKIFPLVYEKKKKVGIGLVGAGSIGRVHARNLAYYIPRARLVGIADTYVDAANKLAAELEVDKVSQDYNELLENPEVDALLLAVPPFLKPEMISNAARKGKHIFVEKPLALSLKEADQIIAAADKGGIKVQVGYQRRFDNSLREAENAIKAGKLGRILFVSSRTRDPPAKPLGWSTDPKLSGGIMLDTCSHDFDVIRWLSGKEVERVYADGVTLVYEELKQGGIPDNVLVTLNLQGGALAHVDSCGYTVYGYDSSAEVLGTEGAVFVGIGERNSALVMNSDGYRGQFPQSYPERFGQAYHDELEDFVDCILHDRQVRVTAADGRAAVEIGLAATESMKRHEPINLPFRG
jgi:myo-inositol 2-dehydrogenase/D-chiro-inositol 1-dehydrogenase